MCFSWLMLSIEAEVFCIFFGAAYTYHGKFLGVSHVLSGY